MVKSVDKIQSVGILGAGLMGHGIAQEFSLKGFKVQIYDSNSDALQTLFERIRSNLETLSALSMSTPEDIDNCLSGIKPCEKLSEACHDVELVIEAVSEDMTLKKELYQAVEKNVDSETIICSNTSAFSITELSEALEHKDRFIGTHFWNPPHVIPAVEVIKGKHTSPQVFETVLQVIKNVGKEPVKVLKDVPGFLGNRLQHAMWREAISLAENEVASPEDIDKIVQYGFGLRLASMGPLKTADLAGLDLTFNVHNYLFPYLEDTHEPSSLLRRMGEKNQLGVKTGQGFYSWPQERIGAVKKRRDTTLLNIIKQMFATTQD